MQLLRTRGSDTARRLIIDINSMKIISENYQKACRFVIAELRFGLLCEYEIEQDGLTK